VLPNDALVEGKTIGEWAVEWWTWAFSAPTNQSPLFDSDGSRASFGQSGPVFFLVGGTPNLSGAQKRAFTVPADKYLFLSIVNSEWDNIDTVPPLSPELLRENAAAVIASLTELHASIDGVTVPGLFGHRAISPLFRLYLESPDNALSVAYAHPVAGLIDPIALDGYWLMIEPLAPGSHMINFGAAVDISGFTLDVIDVISVVPLPLSAQIEALANRVLAATLLPQHGKERLLIDLREAGAAFEKSHLHRGIAQLREFQKDVRREAGGLDHALSQQLIADAQKIIDGALAQIREQPKHPKEGEHHENENEDNYSGARTNGPTRRQVLEWGSPPPFGIRVQTEGKAAEDCRTPKRGGNFEAFQKIEGRNERSPPLNTY